MRTFSRALGWIALGLFLLTPAAWSADFQFQPTWESRTQKPVALWWRDAKSMYIDSGLATTFIRRRNAYAHVLKVTHVQ